MKRPAVSTALSLPLSSGLVMLAGLLVKWLLTLRASSASATTIQGLAPIQIYTGMQQAGALLHGLLP